MIVEDPHAEWLAIVAQANEAPESAHAKNVVDTIRRVVGADPGEPLAPLVIGDRRSAAELSAAYLQDWRRRHPVRWVA